MNSAESCKKENRQTNFTGCKNQRSHELAAWANHKCRRHHSRAEEDSSHHHSVQGIDSPVRLGRSKYAADGASQQRRRKSRVVEMNSSEKNDWLREMERFESKP